MVIETNMTLGEIFGSIRDKRIEAREKNKKEHSQLIRKKDVMSEFCKEVEWLNEEVLTRGTETDYFKKQCRRIALYELVVEAFQKCEEDGE